MTKAVPLDDLQVGDWIAVLRINHPSPEIDVATNGEGGTVTVINPMHVIQQQNDAANFPWKVVDGRPHQVLAISYPFLAIYCPVMKRLFPVDVRGSVSRLWTTDTVNVATHQTFASNNSHVPSHSTCHPTD